MRQRNFKQVDVFTGTPYRGNPLAVVLDGTGLSDEQMQHFARWTNLSETTFLLPPQSEAAEYEDLSGEENLTLDHIVTNDRRSHQALR